jgi:hypothetical protein
MGFVLKNSGKCDEAAGYVYSASMCQQAAEELGLSDTTPDEFSAPAIGEGATNGDLDYQAPDGCIWLPDGRTGYSNEKLYFNTGGGVNYACSNGRKCICKAFSYPYTYVMVTSGTCASQAVSAVTSKNECEYAATWLESTDTTAGNIDDDAFPPNCYFKSDGGVLAFNNAAGSSVECSSARQCLCVAG